MKKKNDFVTLVIILVCVLALGYGMYKVESEKRRRTNIEIANKVRNLTTPIPSYDDRFNN